jgi:hypothetical protein
VLVAGAPFLPTSVHVAFTYVSGGSGDSVPEIVDYTKS